jgi:DNA-binding NarL/FixJ family response regulator
MTCYVEVWGAEGIQLVALEADELTIGRGEGSDLVLANDDSVSRLHAAVRQLSGGWSVRDLGSRNGTLLNGERVDNERALYGGDEILIGQTRLVFRGDNAGGPGPTMGAERPPDLTRRERDVLVALFRPAAGGNVFSEPASTREMAKELCVSEAAVKQHLAHLYDKFGIHGDGERRRVRLANEALRRGAVNLAEVRSKTSSE